MDEWIPRQSDIDWTKEHISKISEGGQAIQRRPIHIHFPNDKTYEAIVNATHTEMHVAMQTMTVLKELGYEARSMLVDVDGSLVQSNLCKFQDENL